MRIVLVSLVAMTALAVNSAHAGSLAPAPRVVSSYDRDFIERYGSQTFEELLDTSIVRYFFTGGQNLPVLVNGRPYASTAGNLDTIPLSAVERIELLGGDSLGTLGGSAVAGAINIVLRSDVEGFETRALARSPSRDGGTGVQGSVFWGGSIGNDGRMTLGVDLLDRQEITARSREFSRSEWSEGGSFSDSKNVSIGGNTVWVVDKSTGDVRTVSLGACDPAHGYTGPLKAPPGATNPDDEGCGYAYGNIMWNSRSFSQQSAVLNLDHPFGESAELHLDAILARGSSAFRYAPSIGSFVFSPTAGLIDAINQAGGSGFEATTDNLFVVSHRFVGHGNRDWFTDTEEYDVSLSIEGRLAEGLGYDASVNVFHLNGFLFGDTFVHRDTIAGEIQDGNYDLEDPFSTEATHLEAIRKSSAREENDFGADYLGTRLALEGIGGAIGGRNAVWTAGVELERVELHDRLVFRGRDGQEYNVSTMLGSGGTSYAGKRNSYGMFAETSIPIAETLDLRLAGRQDEADDVGGLGSWSVGAEYRLNDAVTLRGSWGVGDRPASMLSLYSTEVQDHPYVECDPGGGDPADRSCPSPNPRQVTRLTQGNPNLDPSELERIMVGGEFRRGAVSLGAELYRHSRTGLPGRNSADWAMLNLPVCEAGDTMDCISRTGGDITIHTSYANVIDTRVAGVKLRFRSDIPVEWGTVGVRSIWQHIVSSELRTAGEVDTYPVPKNAAYVRFFARRGDLSAYWTANYRSEIRNRSGVGRFESWVGHDLTVDWVNPLGLEDARISAGVFNITDEPLSENTANPSSTDGPTAAGWGRTFFLTFHKGF
ncbi:MAG: TonB-dependent receptor [Paracoccaceae bacterium]|nr:TonB-dependent receptor [Paracoccaceae bacterium]